MNADLQEHLERVPFVPFMVRTSDGHEYSVPAVDHSKRNRAIVIADNGVVAIFGPLHISSVSETSNGS